MREMIALSQINVSAIWSQLSIVTVIKGKIARLAPSLSSPDTAMLTQIADRGGHFHRRGAPRLAPRHRAGHRPPAGQRQP